MFVDLVKPFSDRTWTLQWRKSIKVGNGKFFSSYSDMGVSKNRGTPKWMVYNGKPYWNGWFGGTPMFGNTHMWWFVHTWIWRLSTTICFPCPTGAPVDWVRPATWHEGAGSARLLKDMYVLSLNRKKLHFPRTPQDEMSMNEYKLSYVYIYIIESICIFAEGKTCHAHHCQPVPSRIRWMSAGGFGFGCMGFLWRSLGRSSSERGGSVADECYYKFSRNQD